MDSVSSGSMQSSSGGDEEYDSRAETISAFLSNQQQGHDHASSLSKYQVHQQHAHFFDPLPNYFNPVQRSASSLSNPDSLPTIDIVRSKPVGRSDPYHDLGPLIPSSSSSQNPTFFQSQISTGLTGGTGPAAAFSNTQHPLLPLDGTSVSRSLLSVSASTDQARNAVLPTTNNNNVGRNPKKRSRASRRAPTTVLTTDTTNFRAMVQEFTGIPAPPFTSSHFPRSRLHFLGTAAASTMRFSSSQLDPQPVPNYLMRPFAQKVQPLPHSLAPRNPVNMNMHTNPTLSFHPDFPLANSYPMSTLGSRPQGYLDTNPLGTADPNLKMGSDLQDFGLSPGHLNTNQAVLPDMVNSSSSDKALSRGGIHIPSTSWGNARVIDNNEQGQGLNLSSSLSGNLSTNCKVNCSASSSGFHGEKGPDCVPTARTEGMVESWINCSSD